MSRSGWPDRGRRAPGRPGRPRKAPDELRSIRIRIRLSERELAWLKEQAEGRPLPGWIRQRLLGEPKSPLHRIPVANRVIAGQFAKIGNNINQLVRLVHTGRFVQRLEPLLHQLYEMLVQFQRELLGGPR